MQVIFKQQIRWGAFTLLLMLMVLVGRAQNTSDLEFNEVLVLNDSLNIDDYGQYSSWIEIFNKGYNTVDIGGCYLTDELDNSTKYWIPTGDPGTQIPPRCFILFWADGKPTRGIFHLNFELRGAKTIGLYDSNGRVLIDELDINVPHISNRSYGRIDEDINDWVILEKITPLASNDHTKRVSSGEKFVEMDPTGLGMTLIAMLVVFSSLAMLYLIFKATGNYFLGRARKAKKAELDVLRASAVNSYQEDLSGETSAAIAMALHLFMGELHDEENTVLTIKKVSRTYSPWSSKIYTLRKYPRQ